MSEITGMLAKYLAHAKALGGKAKGLAGELAHSDVGKDIGMGAAVGAPLEMALGGDEDDGLAETGAKGAAKGAALNAGTMALLRKLGL